MADPQERNRELTRLRVKKCRQLRKDRVHSSGVEPPELRVLKQTAQHQQQTTMKRAKKIVNSIFHTTKVTIIHNLVIMTIRF